MTTVFVEQLPGKSSGSAKLAVISMLARPVSLQCDSVKVWRCHSLTVLQCSNVKCDSVTVWQWCSVTVWPCYSFAVWQCDSVAYLVSSTASPHLAMLARPVSLPSHSLTPATQEDAKIEAKYEGWAFDRFWSIWSLSLAGRPAQYLERRPVY